MLSRKPEPDEPLSRPSGLCKPVVGCSSRLRSSRFRSSRPRSRLKDRPLFQILERNHDGGDGEGDGDGGGRAIAQGSVGGGAD